MSGRDVSLKWIGEGLRFECTLCGACCSGPEGYVLFTEEEASGLAARLGVTVEAFYDRYAHKTREGWSLREKKTEHGLDCVFLDRSDGLAKCGVYEDRPMQCRTWPWWPENVRSEAAWRQAAKHCEGIGQGPVIPVEHIRIQRDATPK